MPHYMRQGFGRMMIDFSYHLTKLEGKTGSPERPLSDLGLLTYRKYWLEVIVNHVNKMDQQRETISIKDISQDTGVSQDDLVSKMQYFGLVKYWKGKHIVLKNKVCWEM